MLSSLKVLFYFYFLKEEGNLGCLSNPRRTPKFDSNNCLTNNFLRWKFLLSMLSSQKFYFARTIMAGRREPHRRLPNLVRTIVSHTASYIVSSTIYVEQLKSFILEGQFGGLSCRWIPNL